MKLHNRVRLWAARTFLRPFQELTGIAAVQRQLVQAYIRIDTLEQQLEAHGQLAVDVHMTHENTQIFVISNLDKWRVEQFPCKLNGLMELYQVVEEFRQRFRIRENAVTYDVPYGMKNIFKAARHDYQRKESKNE